LNDYQPNAIPPGERPLTGWHRTGLWTILIVILAFGGLVEMRSAFLKRRMTDLDVYLRTAWAVRTGADIYDVLDDNEWHYQYPPLLAILATPLADAPAGASRAFMLPFSVSVALWYALSVLAVAWAIHAVAAVLEDGDRVRSGSLRWWQLRTYPFLVCILAIGSTLMRGQVNLFVLALLAMLIVCLARRQSLAAGLWLGMAICIKVIPAFLLVVPFWLRDRRCLAGSCLGLAIGLLAIPSLVFGPSRTLTYYQEYADKLLLPGLGKGSDQSRAKELIEVTATDSQSPLCVYHNTLHLDRDTRPRHASAGVRWAHRLTGVLLTLGTVAAYGRKRRGSAIDLTLLIGAIMIVMVLMSPVCHLHYFCMCIPAVLGLAAASWEANGQRQLSRKTVFLFILYPAINLLPHLPWFPVLRDVGAAMYMAILIWAAACMTLMARRQAGSTANPYALPKAA
jgi:alpha-1,2-mannosyltransferase